MASVGQTVAGTNFSASASLPSTYDATGFGALTFTAGDTCEIVDVGEIGYEWTTAESNTICTDPVVTKKSRKKMSPFTLTLNYVKGDALQDILEASFASKTSVISIKVTEPNGTDVQWCTAQVSKFGKVFGGGEDFITRTVEFMPQNDWVYNA